MSLVFQCLAHDLLWGQADAVVGDVHATIAGTEGDLLSAVGVAVKPRFPNDKFQATPQFVRYGVDSVAQIVETFGFVRRGARDAGGTTVFAMYDAHLSRPFAGCDASLGSGDGGGHDIVAVGRSRAQIGEGFFHSDVVPLFAPIGQARNLFLLHGRVHHHDTTVACHQWGGFSFLELVYANHYRFSCFDTVEAFGVTVHKTGFHIIDGANRAAHTFQIGQFSTGAVF
mmetsp:Transcript_24009/g.44096  ORF Transcript_24009/g.44096 Transcript_24009/m.44096 type:complete len:227 (-) Transcript_24009:6994-7674(-)